MFGAAAMIFLNIYPFFVDHCPHAAFCFDNYWNAGFPLTFYEYGSIAHLNDILFLGLVTNFSFGLGVAFVSGLSLFSLGVGLRRCKEAMEGWRR